MNPQRPCLAGASSWFDDVDADDSRCLLVLLSLIYVLIPLLCVCNVLSAFGSPRAFAVTRSFFFLVSDRFRCSVTPTVMLPFQPPLPVPNGSAVKHSPDP